MEIEADLFMIFQGWDAGTTASMGIPELMQWHKIAIERHTSQEGG
ncbi:GpE family phage tail protein [Aeromonas aquatica]